MEWWMTAAEKIFSMHWFSTVPNRPQSFHFQLPPRYGTRLRERVAWQHYYILPRVNKLQGHLAMPPRERGCLWSRLWAY